MPGAGRRAGGEVDLPLVHRAAEMGAGRSDRVNAITIPQEHHRRALGLHPDRFAVRQLRFADDIHPRGRLLFERGVVHADAEGVGQVVISDPYTQEESLIDVVRIKDYYKKVTGEYVRNIMNTFKSLNSEILVINTKDSFINPVRRFFMGR